ncbi:hypothetical protein WH47_12482 [Habropoda laboriosa]|uniref:Uncharacterized protein n=1 Tax=Habropoda laboriosa TaxID=597456 RepID=A0A0L7QZZ8_9HYME|nr:hypothetical protein WH47_12482 [Habropoda laboriosa]
MTVLQDEPYAVGHRAVSKLQAQFLRDNDLRGHEATSLTTLGNCSCLSPLYYSADHWMESSIPGTLRLLHSRIIAGLLNARRRDRRRVEVEGWSTILRQTAFTVSHDQRRIPLHRNPAEAGLVAATTRNGFIITQRAIMRKEAALLARFHARTHGEHPELGKWRMEISKGGWIARMVHEGAGEKGGTVPEKGEAGG